MTGLILSPGCADLWYSVSGKAALSLPGERDSPQLKGSEQAKLHAIAVVTSLGGWAALCSWCLGYVRYGSWWFQQNPGLCAVFWHLPRPETVVLSGTDKGQICTDGFCLTSPLESASFMKCLLQLFPRLLAMLCLEDFF